MNGRVCEPKSVEEPKSPELDLPFINYPDLLFTNAGKPVPAQISPHEAEVLVTYWLNIVQHIELCWEIDHSVGSNSSLGWDRAIGRINSFIDAGLIPLERARELSKQADERAEQFSPRLREAAAIEIDDIGGSNSPV